MRRRRPLPNASAAANEMPAKAIPSALMPIAPAPRTAAAASHDPAFDAAPLPQPLHRPGDR
jgi:hypothetical protein